MMTKKMKKNTATKITIILFVMLLIVMPNIIEGQKKESPEDQIRRHLRLAPNAPIDIWSIRSKILKIVHIGQPWKSVEKAMSPYGLNTSSEKKETPCWPGDNGLVCEFDAYASDPGGERKYWIEFIYSGENIDNQVLADVAVTLFKGKSVKSTSRFYENE